MRIALSPQNDLQYSLFYICYVFTPPISVIVYKTFIRKKCEKIVHV